MQNKNKKFERKEFNSLEDEYNYLCKRVENLAGKDKLVEEITRGGISGYALVNIHGLDHESWMLRDRGDGMVYVKKPYENTWKLYSVDSKLIEFLCDWVCDYNSRVRPKLLEAVKVHDELRPYVPEDIGIRVSYDGLVTLAISGPMNFHETFDHTDIESDVRLIKFYSDTLHGEFRAYEMDRNAEKALHERVKAILVSNGIDIEVSCLEEYTIYATDATGTKVDVSDLF